MNKAASILACLMISSLASGCDDLDGRAMSEQDRVIRGEQAEAGEFPHQAALLEKIGADQNAGFHAQFCGGTLIEPQWVLTAAHCVTNDYERLSGFIRNGKLTVGVGHNNLTKYTQDNDIAVREVYIHPKTTVDGFGYDIALVHLDEPVEGATGLEMLAKPNNAVDFEQEGEIVGWGSTSIAGGAYPKRLRKAELPVISGIECLDAYSDFYGDEYEQFLVDAPSEVICAGGSSEEADTCYGDSGGPLFAVTGAGKRKLVGVTSGADVGYCGSDLPGVYARVSTVYGWVAGCVQDPDGCESLVPGLQD